MANFYDKASLVLIPSGYKEGKAFSQKPVNGDGDFGVASSATTRVNADGLIEKETQNLLLQSNSFDTTWTISSSTTLTSGQSGYDGSSDAWLLTAIGTFNRAAQSISLSGVKRFSVYAKANTNDYLLLGIVEGSHYYATYNLATGAVDSANANVISPSIEDVGGGWYRCSATWVGTTTEVRIGTQDASGQGAWATTTSGSIYIQDAQLEQGLVARDYLETTTSAVYSGMTDNVPQLDYFDNSCPAYLFEPERTNLVTHSELMDEYFNKQSAAQLVNNDVSPEGHQNAIKIYPTTTGLYRGLNKYFSNTLNNTQYTFSIFAKAGGFDHMFFYEIGSSAGTHAVWFNLATGNVGTSQSAWSNAKMTDMGNGWYKCEATVTYGGTNDYLYILASDADDDKNATANGTDGLYLYGAQLEEGSYPTSYIPTYGTATTRIRNYFNDSVSALYDISNNFSFVIHWRDTKPATSSQNLFSIFTDSPNDFYIYLNASRVNLYIQNGGGYVFGSGANGSWTGPTTKIAITWNNGTKELKYFINGSLFDSGIFPDHNYGTTTAVLPNFAGGNAKSSLEKFLFYKEALSDQECIDLTT